MLYNILIIYNQFFIMGKNKHIKNNIKNENNVSVVDDIINHENNINITENINNNETDNDIDKYKHIQKTLNKNESKIIKPILNDSNDLFLIFECPNCDTQIQVFKNETNCNIFRHGVYKNTYEQIPPHTSKIDCEELLKNDKVFGCCCPFYFCKEPNINDSKIIICDYI